jgi:uncharacterized membrane protein HdeD (DUF308 family)
MESAGTGRDEATLADWIAGKWWLFVLLGAIAIIAGVLALAYPDITLLALGIIFGAYLLVWGIFTLAGAFVPGTPTALVVLRVLVGFLGVLAGLICLVRPGASLLAVLIAFSFWFILIGIADLAQAMETSDNRALLVVLGLVSVAAGVIILGNPDIGLPTLALLVGIGLLVRGTLEIVMGFALRSAREST